ncbi:MAG: DUF21 domain-containing protein [Hyphomicrobiaceae bacterium]|nr:DUF21 domain-containing protein [Hyphomicrobiaceae bacterium]
MSNTLVSLLIAFLLLAANAFYVAAEFALVKSKSYRIDNLAKEGRFGAALTQRMLHNVEAYLAVCQLGITMASLGLGWVGEPTVAALLLPVLEPLHLPESLVHLIAFLAGFLIFSSLHIVVGEQVPKTFAIREPEPVSLWIAYPLHVTYVIFFPLTWLLNAASRSILNMFGVKEASHQEILSGVEIEGLVEVSAEHGKLDEPQAEFIHNVFRFSELEVDDVMVHRTRMVALDAEETTEVLVEQILESPYTRMPLYHDKMENIVGIVHAKDVLRAIIKADGDLTRVNIPKLASKPWFVPETRSVQSQLNAFLREKKHIALVVDEYGEVQGLITLEDVIEEIVGEIADEHDIELAGVTPESDGSFLVDGQLAVRDLNRSLDWELPDEEATTIAGLIIHEAKVIPDQGQQFTFHGFRFKIVRKQRNRITQVRVTPLAAQPVAE